ncbi:hypothetical protein MTR67_044075 [Solanum verrucosum]|uniref:Uncharacterized protein n=1 Tax=Solanum verrucosum TaxID=315347 RepID=A0AAF0ZVA7_SOLVR|nr:hypothetical protein MTR67_044075 [Solanum verrucosum]
MLEVKEFKFQRIKDSKKIEECFNRLFDIIEETCDNSHNKEKKAKVSDSMGNDFSRSRTSEGTDGKGRGKKREGAEQDLDCTVSQHSADAEDSGLAFLLVYIC